MASARCESRSSGVPVVADKLRLRQCDSLVHLTGIRKLPGIHQLDRMIVRQRLGHFSCNGSRFFPLVRVAISVDLARNNRS